MLAKTLTCAVVGLEGALVEVEVEVDIGPGLPAFNIVSLPDAAVQEAKERVRAAVKNSGCVFPIRRITVNLAPADLSPPTSARRPQERGPCFANRCTQLPAPRREGDRRLAAKRDDQKRFSRAWTDARARG